MCRFGEYMQYWGKIIGVAVALLMGGGFWGVVLGLLIGHMFDKARSRKMAWFANQRERQALFFATTFEVMGHLTKSKGRVTEADIHIASQLMDRMNLHGASRTAEMRPEVAFTKLSPARQYSTHVIAIPIVFKRI